MGMLNVRFVFSWRLGGGGAFEVGDTVSDTMIFFGFCGGVRAKEGGDGYATYSLFFTAWVGSWGVFGSMRCSWSNARIFVYDFEVFRCCCNAYLYSSIVSPLFSLFFVQGNPTFEGTNWYTNSHDQYEKIIFE